MTVLAVGELAVQFRGMGLGRKPGRAVMTVSERDKARATTGKLRAGL